METSMFDELGWSMTHRSCKTSEGRCQGHATGEDNGTREEGERGETLCEEGPHNLYFSTHESDFTLQAKKRTEEETKKEGEQEEEEELPPVRIHCILLLPPVDYVASLRIFTSTFTHIPQEEEEEEFFDNLEEYANMFQDDELYDEDEGGGEGTSSQQHPLWFPFYSLTFFLQRDRCSELLLLCRYDL